MRPEISAPFDSSTPQAGVCVVDGYGVRIFVRRRHLVILDGLGRDRRERVFARATAGIRRVVILGNEGFVTLEALRWLADLGIVFIHLDRDARVLAASALPGNDDPRLRRAQAAAMTNRIGIRIAQWILHEKVAGQLAVLGQLPNASKEAGRELGEALEAIQVVESLPSLLAAEAAAANAYWASWAEIPVRFIRADHEHIPDHWQTFGHRGSPLTGSPRLAANPANALLNYLYAILEAEARSACLRVGLDPGLGVLHRDQRSRDSMALDLMEVARPEVDTYVLSLLTSHTFRARDFHETRQGVCRVLAPLTHSLAETSPAWSNRIGRAAEHVAQMLAYASGSSIRDLPTPLTQDNRSAGREGMRRGPRRAPKVNPKHPRPACRICGVVLSAGRLYCDTCLLDRKAELFSRHAEAGHKILEELRTARRDPAHGGEAARKRGSRVAEHRRAISEWEKTSRAWPDPAKFTREILPSLREVALTRMMEATGLSHPYCFLIRRGLRVPHPRHWEALRRLTTPG